MCHLHRPSVINRLPAIARGLAAAVDFQAAEEGAAAEGVGKW